MNKRYRKNHKTVNYNRLKCSKVLIILVLIFLTSCKKDQSILNVNIPASETVSDIASDGLEESRITSDDSNKSNDDHKSILIEPSEDLESEHELLDSKHEPIESELETLESEPETIEYSQITLSMIGDVLLHGKIHDSGIMEDGSLDYNHLFAQIKEEISAVDLAIVNQEVILGGKELGLSGYPCFNGAFEVGDALVTAGFDVVLHATNHTLDKGKKGVLKCMDFWKTNYPEIAILGINESQEAQDNNIYVYEKDNIKVAILNYTYGTNGIPLPDDMPYIVNLIDKNKIEQDVMKANELADFVVVTLHWGKEYKRTPSESQVELASFMADLGVDLVIGAHPHVVQPVEWIESENGNKMLIYYSIGNFISATNLTGDGVSDRMVGAMANVTIEKYPGEEAYIKDYGAKPIITQVKTGAGLITSYLLEDYSTELAIENEIVNQDPNFSLEYCVDVWNETFPEFQY